MKQIFQMTEKKQNGKFNNFIPYNNIKKTQTTFLSQLTDLNLEETTSTKIDNVAEINVHIVPKFLTSEYQSVFPNVDITDLKHVIIVQKTENDMIFWNGFVEKEREELAAKMNEMGSNITEKLIEMGYWADFIDPESGLPSKTKSSTCLFENDESYIHFGLKIKDLSCCKVICHKIWGTRVYVGSIFTNAPVEEVNKLLSL
jgi:hypothetical protein